MTDEQALRLHEKTPGKITVEGTVPLESQDDLEKAYTPGVAAAVDAIDADPSSVYRYTAKGRMAAVISDGSAVLGLGDVGPEAAIPVMEGKALLLQELGAVSAFPILLDETDQENLFETAKKLHPMFGFMMVEDIASPGCFRLEQELKDELDIPVMHDDQHGAAIAVLGALENALAIVEKDIEEIEVVVVGAGAAGIATGKLLDAAGVDDLWMVDRPGILTPEMDDINWAQRDIAALTNPDCREGELADAVAGADVLIGLSAPGIVSQEMVESMAEDPIVFPLANPRPEISADDARAAGAAVVGTGRSGADNQINNVLVFPGVARGLLESRATDLTTEMKLAAADALASCGEPAKGSIVPSPLNKSLHDRIAEAVADAARDEGVVHEQE
ncbi:MAG: NAD-dependent malic enzyme [Candidatus Nanohaloarchaeota archaeon QJJ-5]|nr:NAD-dependent malic enzyme [Candidatus Nanohaloarchaeota archaeon QJJ-5]